MSPYDSAPKEALLALAVGDIKQYVYCPRIVYFRYVLPIRPKPTVPMQMGSRRHEIFSRLDSRRTGKKYQLKEGTKLFNCAIYSPRLALSGSLDMLIETASEIFPVEYKNSEGEPQLHHRYQLAAYALLTEERYNRIIRNGYICMLRSEKVWPVEITESRKKRVHLLMREMRRTIAEQTLPRPTPHQERCVECEYRHYCADTV